MHRGIYVLTIVEGGGVSSTKGVSGFLPFVAFVAFILKVLGICFNRLYPLSKSQLSIQLIQMIPFPCFDPVLNFGREYFCSSYPLHFPLYPNP